MNLPKPLNEALPYINVTAGVVSLYVSGALVLAVFAPDLLTTSSILTFASGALFGAAGVVELIKRNDYRKRQSEIGSQGIRARSS